MGRSKLVGACALAAAGFAFLLAACGATESPRSSQNASAGSSTTGGASGDSGGEASGAGGAASGQVGVAVAGRSSGGTPAGGAAGSAAAGQSAGGEAGALANVFVEEVRRQGCLPRELPVVEEPSDGFETGQVRCGLTEVVAPAAGAACACDASQHLAPTKAGVAKAVLQLAQANDLCGGRSSPSW